MASHKPLVLVAGQIRQLPDGDVLAGNSEVDVVETTAKEILGAGQPVYISGAGEVMLADADAAGKARVYGLAQTAAALDATVPVQTDGIIEVADWTAATGAAALTPGDDYYLATTAGQLTTVVPTAGAVVYVGIAVTTTRMDLSIERPITL